MRTGYIYVLHFDDPLHHAEHYAGCTTNPRQRLQTHATGNGSRLCEVLMERGITWRLGSLATCSLKDMRTLERQLKRQHESGRYCELCSERDGVQPRRLPGTMPMSIDLIRWATDSQSLAAGGRVRLGIKVELAGEQTTDGQMEQVKALMGFDRHALGFIPARGQQGVEWSRRNGRLVLATLGDQVVGFVVFTVGEDSAKIHQCCTAEAYRECGVARRMVDYVCRTNGVDRPVTCWVRDDLAANEFWRKIGFNYERSKTHKTSKSTLHHYTIAAGSRVVEFDIPDLLDSMPMPARNT